MFEGNIITFNPGWDANANPLAEYDDVREIEKHLKENGIALDRKTTTAKGPASVVLKDPDGNVILLDQHVG